MLKKEIKEWSAAVSQKKNPEWLILQIVTPDQTKQGRGGAFGFGGTVYEKLKADFATPDKRSRCVSHDPASVATLADIETITAAHK